MSSQFVFNEAYYLSQYADVRAAVAAGLITAQAHWEQFGWREERNPNAQFNTAYYATNNTDVVAAQVNYLDHFLANGASEGRLPNSSWAGTDLTKFDSEAYYAANPDVKTAGMDALTHYMLHGQFEARTGAQLTDGTVITAPTADANAGQTFTLTTGTDNIVGTSGNDTITGANTTFTTGDNIDGGAGTDTLKVTFAAAAKNIATLKAVENVVLEAGLDDNTGVINASNWTGVNKVTLKGMGVDVKDSNGVTGTAGWGVTALQSNVTLGLDSVTVGTTNNDALYASFASDKVGSATATLSLEVNNVGTDTNTADFLVETAGTDKFTKLNVAATGKNYISLEKEATADSLPLTDITVTGAGDLTLAVDGAKATVKELTTFNASGSTGAITADVSASTKAVTFTGSAGKNTIKFGNGANVITGGASDDTFTIGAGTNKVTAAAGNDTVIGKLAEFAAADTIDLGEGTRDMIVYSDVTTLNSSGITAAQKTILNGYSGVEGVGSSATDVTAIDAGFFTQNIFKLSGTNTKDIAMSNVDSDTLILATGIAAATNDALSVTGALPNSTFNLELAGAASIALYSKDGNAADAGLTIASGVSTVNITSTTTKSSTTGLKNGISADNDATLDGTSASTATYAIDNASAGSFTLKGNVDFTVDGGKTAGFSKAVDFNASEFTGKLTFAGSADADKVTGGKGNDTIAALGGANVIDLSAGGNDKVSFAAADAKNTITGFTTGGDTLAFAGIKIGGGGAITATTGTAVSAGTVTAGVLTDNTVYVINDGSKSLVNGGTKTVTDYTDLTVVATYLNEAYTSTADDDAAVFVINDLAGKKTYVYSFDETTAGASTISSAELVLVGVITEANGAAVTALDIA